MCLFHFEAKIICPAEAYVLVALNKNNLRKFFGNHIGASIIRGAVDNDHLKLNLTSPCKDRRKAFTKRLPLNSS